MFWGHHFPVLLSQHCFPWNPPSGPYGERSGAGEPSSPVFLSLIFSPTLLRGDIMRFKGASHHELILNLQLIPSVTQAREGSRCSWFQWLSEKTGMSETWNYENGRAQDICQLCDTSSSPLRLSPFLSPPLHVGILLIFSFQVDHYSSHSDLLCWNFKNHCAFHIVWPISYLMPNHMERSCHTDTHRHTHRDTHAHAYTDAHTSYICKHTHTQSNFIILWLFWTNRILGVSLTLTFIGEETGAESLGDFLQVGRKWGAIFIFIFTLIKVLYANLDVEVNCPLLSSRGEERIFCRRKGFHPKTGRWAQCCETVAGDSVVWSTARIPFKCIQVEATEHQRGKTAWT